MNWITPLRANFVGPTWILSAPRWANVGPTCLVIWNARAIAINIARHIMVWTHPLIASANTTPVPSHALFSTGTCFLRNDSFIISLFIVKLIMWSEWLWKLSHQLHSHVDYEILRARHGNYQVIISSIFYFLLPSWAPCVAVFVLLGLSSNIHQAASPFTDPLIAWNVDDMLCLCFIAFQMQCALGGN